MSYRTRLSIAVAVSILLNALLWHAGGRMVEAKPVSYDPVAASPPIRLKMRSDPPKPEPKRLIETAEETLEPVEKTDLISDKNSKAQDESDVESERPAPFFEEPSDFDAPEKRPSEPIEPAPLVAMVPVQPPRPAAETPSMPLTEEPAPVGELKAVEPQEISDAPVNPAPEPAEEPDDGPADTPREALPERFEVAQAEKRELKFVEELQAAKGREDGGAKGKGFTSFEAKQHEMAEYMLEVRQRVERHWRAGLMVKYHGVRRTQAIVECSIRPSGLLEYVRIVDAGDSHTFALICQEAINKAGPFPKFPFDVPEIYRSKNLEITWRFSYL